MSTNGKEKIRAGIVGVGNWGRYGHLPVLQLLPDASVLDLAYLYAAYANDRQKGTRVAPTFADAVKMHRPIDLISAASSTGTRQTVDFWRSSA
jgi:predicted dehydrogenase